MEQTLLYTSPTTGVMEKIRIPDPSIELADTGEAHGLPDEKEVFYLTNNTTNPFAIMAQGLEFNRMNGGAYVPHGALHGQEATLAATANSSATSIVVRQYLTPDGRPIFEPGGKYFLMNRRPKEGERAAAFANTDLDVAIITVDSGYDYTTDGATVTVSALPATYQRGAVVQKIMPMGASYDMERGQDGLRTQKQRPAALTNVSAADGGSQVIDVTFTPSTQKAVRGYMIQVVKKGDAFAPIHLVEVPEWVQPAEYASGGQHEAIIAADSALLVANQNGTVTVSDINRYYKSDYTLSAIVAGTYFVIVRALTATTLDASCVLGEAVSVSVTVA